MNTKNDTLLLNSGSIELLKKKEINETGLDKNDGIRNLHFFLSTANKHWSMQKLLLQNA